MTDVVRLRVSTRRGQEFPIAAILCLARLTPSQMEGRRQLAQGAVTVDGRRVRRQDAGLALPATVLIRVGARAAQVEVRRAGGKG